MKRRQPKVYAMLRKTYSLDALKLMGFIRHGSQLLKLGAGRRVRAQASSLDGITWRVRPMERHWR